MWVIVEQTISLPLGKMIQTGVTLSFTSRCKLTICNGKLIKGNQKDGGTASKGGVIFWNPNWSFLSEKS